MKPVSKCNFFLGNRQKLVDTRKEGHFSKSYTFQIQFLPRFVQLLRGHDLTEFITVQISQMT